MHTNKGYMVPVILILILLALAGFFIFYQKTVESPVVEIPVPQIENSTSSEDSFETKTLSDLESENTSTTTASNISTSTKSEE